MAKRKRSQEGQRISPWPVQPLGVKVNVTCPICFRASWMSRVFDQVPAWGGGYVRAPDPWAATPLILRVMRQWPRKPDGSRGFYWETLDRRNFEEQNPRIVAAVYYRFALKMIEWLDRLGVDVSSAVASEGLERLQHEQQ
jgi:hypothetical protein